MPSRVWNTLRIACRNREEREAVLSGIGSRESAIDFNRIVPAPDHADLDWARSNWGTKWNAGDAKVVENPDAPLEIVLEFDTAWKPPFPVLRVLAKRHPHLRIENTAEFECGNPTAVFVFHGGKTEVHERRESFLEVW